MKKEKTKCRYCGKSGKLKYYIIADDLEKPKPYHPKCYKKWKLETLFILLFGINDKKLN